ncbi:LLM class F420-dependent oxidoreductase [Aquipuribacter nitratireducens]|uniref:LLM class F420-dependent oxidoreductase n=1 Tax=Aquipuribacter nitratireducens TaxID=650104 RepID=A0ABW0GI97_9MICO
MRSGLRLGLNLGYWGTGDDASNLVLAQEADRLGYDVVWVAEAYGSDAPTVMAWVAAQTERIGVGSAVMQIPARTPAMTAMTAATLDTLSQGRFRLGLGVSGPQVSEGWHGVRFDDALGRTREYVDVVRLALARRPVAYEGRHLTLPLPDGPGKALRLTVTPVREHVPLYLASLGPRNLRLTGELADGWLGLFVSPGHVGDSLARIEEGRRAAGHDGLAGFDVSATLPLVLTPDGAGERGDDAVAAAADPVRGYVALYVGGMGSRQQNFYNALARRMGYDAAAEQVQELYLDRRPREAAAAVPTELVDATSLLGPRARVAERLAALADAGVTTVNVTPFAPDLGTRLAMLRGAAAALEASGRAA